MKAFNIDGQLSMFQPISAFGCSGCVCSSCFHHAKGDCPEGGCYDDRRALENSYIETHHGAKRTFWSNWDKPGEQDHWCRGGMLYNQLYCDKYVRYAGQKVQSCLLSNVSVFQDGSIRCSLVDTVGCEECYKRFNKEHEDKEDAA